MTKNTSDSFKDFVEDQLSDLEGLAFKSMFGGWGIYAGEQFFGIIFKDGLYFKTNEDTRGQYKKFGMKPFRPSAKQRLKNYFEVPADILEDSQKLKTWALESAELSF